MKLFRNLFLVFAICIFALSAASLSSSVSSLTQEPVKSSSAQGSYIVRRDGDNVAVYRAGSDAPLGILDVRFSDLPEEDRELLECGIMVENDSQLLAIIEDYNS
ncbi:MAG: hypothetical protein IJC18_01625 [Clostridia bacterium]|nr:hypothetical protein [Clostridia bacterium]